MPLIRFLIHAEKGVGKLFVILNLNLGSTSTKVSIYEDEKLFQEFTARHTDEEMLAAPTQKEQIAMRKQCIQKWLRESNISLDRIDAAVVRMVGLRRCVKSGTYQIGEVLRKDIYALYEPDGVIRHSAGLTVPLLEELMEGRNIPIYMVDTVHVNEFKDVARITGHPKFEWVSVQHTLNQKAIARLAAAELGKPYEACKFVVAHLGGGVSIGAHEYGRIVDSSNCGAGCSGPFSPTRTGTLPTMPLIEMCYSGKYTYKEMEKMIMKEGGFAAYLGVTDCRAAEEMAENGDEKADLILRAFAYQVAKEIGAQCAALQFRDIDAILLTGGISYSKRIVSDIKHYLGDVAPVRVYPGEREAEAMVDGVLQVLRGQREAMVL